jgi:glucose-6-phosphate dehydrogenase assembly protein OpcA
MLLVAELPDFLWWRSSVLLEHPLFRELTDISDRLIVDSSELKPRSHSMRAIARIAMSPRSDLRLSDLTWARISPWRMLIAQHFDNPIAQAALDGIQDVFIGYRGADDSGSAGLPSATLLVGWMASRLKWQAPGELVRDGNGWRVTLRAGKFGSRREVVVQMMPVADAGGSEDLKEVQIRADQNGQSSCSIQCVDAACLLTENVFGNSPPTSRIIHTRSNDSATLISDELRKFGRDTVFEDALVFAAGLMPNGVRE